MVGTSKTALSILHETNLLFRMTRLPGLQIVTTRFFIANGSKVTEADKIAADTGYGFVPRRWRKISS